MTPERTNKIEEVLNRRQPDLGVVLDSIEDPHNIFAVLRTCDAVGIQDVYIVNTRFKRHKKHGNKSSSSAAKWLTQHRFETLEECMEVVKKRYDKLYAGYLGEASSSIYEMDLTQSMALAFGNEHFGISDEVLSYCDGTFIIPQVGMIRSLNISVACAVTLYEAKRQRMEKGFYDGTPRLPAMDRAVLHAKWHESRHTREKRGE